MMHVAFTPFCFVATETQEVGLRGSRGFDAVAPCSRKINLSQNLVLITSYVYIDIQGFDPWGLSWMV